jgi:hypothetical protein
LRTENTGAGVRGNVVCGAVTRSEDRLEDGTEGMLPDGKEEEEEEVEFDMTKQQRWNSKKSFQSQKQQ